MAWRMQYVDRLSFFLLLTYFWTLCSEHHMLLFPGVRTEPMADLSWRWALDSPWSLLQVGMWCSPCYSKRQLTPSSLPQRQPPRRGHHLQIWMQTWLLCVGKHWESSQEVSYSVLVLGFHSLTCLYTLLLLPLCKSQAILWKLHWSLLGHALLIVFVCLHNLSLST
jgi:hypothetical protein